MNKTTSALKLAEEALDELHYSSGTVKAVTLYKSALAAIRDALAEQSMVMILNAPHPPHRCCECAECLEYFKGRSCDDYAKPELNLNCKSVQARLATVWGYVKAEPVQEPVAWRWTTHNGYAYAETHFDGEGGEPLYAAPVQSVSAKPLCWAHWKSPDYAEYPAFLVTVTEKPTGWQTQSANWFPLYAAPIHTKDLTPDELFSIANKVGFDGELMKTNHDSGMPSIAEQYASAVIAAYREKNRGD